MMHPDTELRTSTSGLGVFASSDIPRGTIVYVKDELEVEISPKEYEGLGKLRRRQVDKFSYVEATGTKVLSWDVAKYVNHSCRPNTMSTGWGVELAVEDISAGTEITEEYGLLNIDSSMRCSCASPLCRGQVCRQDLETFGCFWDELVQAAFCFTQTVEQPLWSLMEAGQQSDIEGYLSGRRPYISVKSLALSR
jgi:hypothetical protein